MISDGIPLFSLDSRHRVTCNIAFVGLGSWILLIVVAVGLFDTVSFAKTAFVMPHWANDYELSYSTRGSWTSVKSVQ